MELKDLVAFLDGTLAVGDWVDDSNNGLQVGDTGEVKKVCCGVDASLSFFEAAKARGADFLIVHHGISWGSSLSRLTGLNYRWVKALIDSGMALYACHLPLDAHPEVGNNAEICRVLGLRDCSPFGRYHGREIGFKGLLPEPMRYDSFKQLVGREISPSFKSMDFGKSMISSVAVISGGAAAEVAQAGEAGVDLYLSGEPSLLAYNLAQQHGVNAIFAGHYATERFGVKALGRLLTDKFALDVEFIDLEINY